MDVYSCEMLATTTNLFYDEKYQVALFPAGYA
jgi:hypothetical protein